MAGRSNIAIFSFAYHPLIGGAERAVEEVTSRLLERRFTCFTNRFDVSPREERIGNVSVVRVGRGTPYEISLLGKLRYILLAWRAAEAEHRREPFHGIWAIMASYGGAAALLFKLRHPRLPLLLTLQEGDAEGHILKRVGIFYPMWRLLFSLATEVQVISQFLREFAIRHGARVTPRIVPNGVDLSKFKIKNQNLKRSDEREKIIITTSRLVPKNGVDILIRACALLQQMNVGNWKLKIVGDGPERKPLKMLARDLGIFDRTEFLGEVSASEIPNVLAGAYIFVRPSRSEGLGSSFLEAMAAGLPIVGTYVGGIKDFLKDGETGLVARAEDPEDVARKIERLFKDHELYNHLSVNGQKLIEKHYTWDHIAKQMEKLFNDLCA